MGSCGYEPTAGNHRFGSLSGFFAMAKAALFSRYEDKGALDLLNNSFAAKADQLVKIEGVKHPAGAVAQLEETRA